MSWTPPDLTNPWGSATPLLPVSAATEPWPAVTVVFDGEPCALPDAAHLECQEGAAVDMKRPLRIVAGREQGSAECECRGRAIRRDAQRRAAIRSE